MAVYCLNTNSDLHQQLTAKIELLEQLKANIDQAIQVVQNTTDPKYTFNIRFYTFESMFKDKSENKDEVPLDEIRELQDSGLREAFEIQVVKPYSFWKALFLVVVGILQSIESGVQQASSAPVKLTSEEITRKMVSSVGVTLVNNATSWATNKLIEMVIKFSRKMSIKWLTQKSRNFFRRVVIAGLVTYSSGSCSDCITPTSLKHTHFLQGCFQASYIKECWAKNVLQPLLQATYGIPKYDVLAEIASYNEDPTL
uniref:Uncharacterized protein n=1 Tax=Ditylenchus dipsaci TaxID=166011 RepID=A0A915EG95_9BILA